MFILVLGNPIGGFSFEGLFTTQADAATYGEQQYPNIEWWIAPLVLNTKSFDKYIMNMRYETQGFDEDLPINPDGSIYDP